MAPTSEQLQAWLPNAVFYPGSGNDLHPLNVFCNDERAQTFINVDYSVLPDFQQGRNGLDLGVEDTGDFGFEEMLTLLNASAIHPANDQWESFCDWKTLRRGRSSWARLRRPSGQEIHVLNLFAEAVWVYHYTFKAQKICPYVVVLQDHGFGLNWARFGGHGSPLFRAASPDALPHLLLVGENTESWQGYRPFQPAGAAGMHGHERVIHRRHV